MALDCMASLLPYCGDRDRQGRPREECGRVWKLEFLEHASRLRWSRCGSPAHLLPHMALWISVRHSTAFSMSGRIRTSVRCDIT